MSTTETPQEADRIPGSCGWCRDPGCDGDHSGDRAEPFECSAPPAESCSDAGCPVHGDSEDFWDADERGDDDD